MGNYGILGEESQKEEKGKKNYEETYIDQTGKGLDLPKHNRSIHVPEKHPTTYLGERKVRNNPWKK